MSESGTEQRSWSNAWPFLLALVVVIVAAAGIGISHLTRPADSRMSDGAQVQHAVNAAYTARNEVNYASYRAATCAAQLSSSTFPDETKFVDENRASITANGRIVIPKIDQITVNGDRATARVHWHFDKKPGQEQVTPTVVVREDGNWKVCAS